MNNRLFCCRALPLLPIRRGALTLALLVVCLSSAAWAGGDAPGWMHALVSVPLPEHDEKTNAVLLFSDTTVVVVSADKVKTHVREAYKILRPGGRDFGVVKVPFDSQQKVTGMRGWCIPAQGKDFEVKDKEAAEVSLPGAELVNDVKAKLLQIPAAEPGNIVGYEYEVEERPLALQDVWNFQELSPAKEKHYSVQLPPGWEYKATFLNYPEVKATGGGGQWQWVVNDVPGIRKEADMPPLSGVAGQMIISFLPPGGRSVSSFASWPEMGEWYKSLTNGRRDASPEIKQKVAALTSSKTTTLAKMKALAAFVQNDVRYVAIELGIGGWQPHPAADIFVHRYGDCKDKATLMGSMLHEIGVESFYVVINAERGSVTDATTAHMGAFDHVVLAIKLPDDVQSPDLLATMNHPKLGRLLFFDPTSELTPLGRTGGYLQANWGLLVSPNGGELVQLPKLAGESNSIERTGQFVLDANGNLLGDIREVRVGDRANSQRAAMRAVRDSKERIKPIESMLAGSISLFRITKATLVNLPDNDQPFEYRYSFEAANYAKSAGGLLMLRLRAVGSKSSSLLETKEARKFAVEFDGPAKDTDVFEFTIPAGYEVEDLPPAVDADFSFASYHSKSTVQGKVIRYTRTFEVKELSVPASRAAELKKFYRMIAGDERNTAVLRMAVKQTSAQ